MHKKTIRNLFKFKSTNYKSNFLLLISIACRLPSLIHSYFPYLLSKVPFCNDLSFRVNLGPSSFSLAFFPSPSNPYLKTSSMISQLSFFTKHLPIVSKEYKISLIMERNGPLTNKLGIVMKQGAKHSAYSQT